MWLALSLLMNWQLTSEHKCGLAVNPPVGYRMEAA